MGKLLIAEIKKLRSLNIWWLVIAGGLLPGGITYLTLFHQEKVEWLAFTNRSLLSFNVQSLLTFAAFAAYLWAREYEEDTIELVLCYPYKRFCLIIAKLILMLFVIILTTVFFLISTLILGSGMFKELMPGELIWKLLNVLLHTDILHLFLVPMYLCIAMVTRASISGLILGITNMCICLTISRTSFVQYIPQCIPYVIGDKQLWVKSMIADHHIGVYYSIAVGTFLIFAAITKVLADRLKK